jgi:hypothetical protein
VSVRDLDAKRAESARAALGAKVNGADERTFAP